MTATEKVTQVLENLRLGLETSLQRKEAAIRAREEVRIRNPQMPDVHQLHGLETVRSYYSGKEAAFREATWAARRYLSDI